MLSETRKVCDRTFVQRHKRDLARAVSKDGRTRGYGYDRTGSTPQRRILSRHYYLADQRTTEKAARIVKKRQRASSFRRVLKTVSRKKSNSSVPSLSGSCRSVRLLAVSESVSNGTHVESVESKRIKEYDTVSTDGKHESAVEFLFFRFRSTNSDRIFKNVRFWYSLFLVVSEV